MPNPPFRLAPVFTDGATLYYNDITGDLTVAPGGGGGSGTLAGLSDVSESSPTNGDLLTYNSALGKWQNVQPSSPPFTTAPFMGYDHTQDQTSEFSSACLRSTPGTVWNAQGVLTSVPANQKRFDYGPLLMGWLNADPTMQTMLLVEGASTNYFLESTAPATQTMVLAPSTYVCWIQASVGNALTDSVTISAGTAAITLVAGSLTVTNTTLPRFSFGQYCVFTVTGTGGTVTFTVSGTPTLCQVELNAQSCPSSHIPTTTSPAYRDQDSVYCIAPYNVPLDLYQDGMVMAASFIPYPTPVLNGIDRSIFVCTNDTYNERLWLAMKSGVLYTGGTSGSVQSVPLEYGELYVAAINTNARVQNGVAVDGVFGVNLVGISVACDETTNRNGGYYPTGTNGPAANNTNMFADVKIGSYLSTGSEPTYPFFGWVGRCAFYDGPANPSQLTSLTLDTLPSFADPTDVPAKAVITGSISGTTLTVNSIASGQVAAGQYVAGVGVPCGTKILSGSGSSWTLNNALTSTATGYLSGNTLTILSIQQGSFAIQDGWTITGPGVTACQIVAPTSSVTVGGIGAYTFSGAAQTVGSSGSPITLTIQGVPALSSTTLALGPLSNRTPVQMAVLVASQQAGYMTPMWGMQAGGNGAPYYYDLAEATFGRRLDMCCEYGVYTNGFAGLGALDASNWANDTSGNSYTPNGNRYAVSPQFCPGSSGTAITSNRNLHGSIPMATTGGSNPDTNMVNIASGMYDSYYTSMAKNIAQYFPCACLRFGWEWNGSNTFPWAFGNDSTSTTTQYAAAVNHVANLFYQVSPRFTLAIGVMSTAAPAGVGGNGSASVQDPIACWQLVQPNLDVLDIDNYFNQQYQTNNDAVPGGGQFEQSLGGARGIYTMAAIARSTGNWIGLGEWGFGSGANNVALTSVDQSLAVDLQAEWGTTPNCNLLYQCYWQQAGNGFYSQNYGINQFPNPYAPVSGNVPSSVITNAAALTPSLGSITTSYLRAWIRGQGAAMLVEPNTTIANGVIVGSISGNTLTVTSVTSGSIQVGQVLTGTGIYNIHGPAPTYPSIGITTITGNIAGSGAGSTWTLSNAVSSGVSGATITLGGTPTGSGFGVATDSSTNAQATITLGSIAGNVLTVTTMGTGTLQAGMGVINAASTGPCFIGGQLTGTPGGAGTYYITNPNSQAQSGVALYAGSGALVMTMTATGELATTVVGSPSFANMDNYYLPGTAQAMFNTFAKYPAVFQNVNAFNS